VHAAPFIPPITVTLNTGEVAKLVGKIGRPMFSTLHYEQIKCDSGIFWEIFFKEKIVDLGVLFHVSKPFIHASLVAESLATESLSPSRSAPAAWLKC
jgi:hypothetical protein